MGLKMFWSFFMCSWSGIYCGDVVHSITYMTFLLTDGIPKNKD